MVRCQKYGIILRYGRFAFASRLFNEIYWEEYSELYSLTNINFPLGALGVKRLIHSKRA